MKEERGEGPDLRDNSRRILRHRLKDLPGAVFRLLDVEHGEDHRERHEDRCVCKLLARADTPTESERDIVWVILRLLTQETLWSEFLWVFEHLRVVCEPPIYNMYGMKSVD